MTGLIGPAGVGGRRTTRNAASAWRVDLTGLARRLIDAASSGWEWAGQSRRRAVGIASLVAAVTYLSALGYQPLSWDEAVSSTAASRSPGRLWHLLQHTDAPLGAYYLLLGGWTRALAAVHISASEGWLRLPSAVAGIVAVAVTAALASTWFGPRTGLLAGALLSVHPLVVFYAHDARPYTIAMAGVVCAAGLLWWVMHRPTAMRVIGYALAAALSLYAHLFAAFALSGQALALACGAVRPHLPGMPRSAARNRMPGRWWALIGLGSASLAALPLYLISRHQTGEIGWIPHLSLATVASFLSRLGGAAMMAPLVVLAAGALVRWPRRAQPRSTGVAGTEQASPEPAPAGGIDGDPRLARWMLVGWVLLPPLALIALDPVQAVLLPRYALVAVPALVMVAAAGARQIGGWWGRGVVVIALLAGAATSAVQQAQPYKYEDFRAAADAVADSARPGDGLVFLPSSLRVGFLAYAGADRDNPHPPSLADVALWPGQGPAVSAQIGGAEVSPGAMAGDLSHYPRVYAIDGSSPSTALPDLAKQAVLSHQYRATWVRWFGGISVTLYLRQTS